MVKAVHLLGPEKIRKNRRPETAHLKQVYATNINETELKSIDLLNELLKLKSEKKIPNVCIALRIFCTLPVSVSSNERSFSNFN